MPPDHDHVNGNVILDDAGSAMRGIVSPIPVGLRRIGDREAGAGASRFFFRLRMVQLFRPVLVRPRPGSLAFRVGVLTADPGTGLGFALVPYRLAGQAPGVT